MPTTFASLLSFTALTILLLGGSGGPIGNAGNARRPAAGAPQFTAAPGA